MNIKDLLERQNGNDKIAILCGKKEISYRMWNARSRNIANKISEIVGEESLNIAIFLPNSINYGIAYFSILFCGKVIVPIGTKSKKTEIVSMLEYCETDLVITDQQNEEYVLECLSDYQHCISVLNIETLLVHRLNESKGLVCKQKYDEDDVVIMLHTSGTTSNPKRVMLTNQSLLYNIESNIASLKLTGEDTVLISMPMYFGYCNTAQFLTHLYLGASMVILDTLFLPKQFLATVEKNKITNFTGVPSMLAMLLDYKYADRHDYSSLRYICFGGAQMPTKKLKELIAKFSTVGFVQTYGQTECSPRVTALLPEYAVSKMGSVGTPIPGVTVKIVDEEENELGANQIGEIIVSGKNIMKGYYKQPTITSEVIRNGWIHTGDLGYIDSDGFLYISGRIKNMIISGGINIYPEEIEHILLQHESVKDACVLSEEHDLLGEVPIAKVVLKDELDISLLKEYCMAYLSDYKVPRRFDIVYHLEKTYNGKTRRY